MSYARTTKVPVTRSLLELQATIEKWGGDRFALMTGEDEYIVGFRMVEDDEPRMIKMRVPLDGMDDQEKRAAMRTLILVVKAKFAAIDTGITTISREFMPYLALPDGSTVEDQVMPQIRPALKGAPLVMALPAPGD